MERLSREVILRAFDALAEELRRAHAKCELLLAGGAAMVLLHNARESTRDVDAVMVDGSRALLDQGARHVAKQFGLPEHWLNDGFKGYLHGISFGPIVYASDTLLIKAVAIEQLLAMKLSAHRDEVDIADAKLLLSQIRGSSADVWKEIQPYLVPGTELKARYAFDDLWDRLHGPS